jgi:asparaginyl-tRNA synthetase
MNVNPTPSLQSARFQFPGRPLPLARRLAVHNRVVRHIRNFMEERLFNEIPVPALNAATRTWEATGRYYLDSMIARGFPAVWCESECLPQEFESMNLRLAGFKRMEAEMVNLELDELCDLMETLLKSVAADLSADLLGGRQVTRLNHMIKNAHPRLTYREALEILNGRGWDLRFGQDLSWKAESSLCRYYGNMPVLITHFPAELRFFTSRLNAEDPTVTDTVDYILPYCGEAMDGAVRETDPQTMREALGGIDLDQSGFNVYLKLFEKRQLHRAGFGLGLTPLLQYLMGVEKISDAVIHPLDRASTPVADVNTGGVA